MPMFLLRTPTWLLLLPSVAVAPAIYQIEEPPSRAAPLAEAASRPSRATRGQSSLDRDIAAIAGFDSEPISAQPSQPTAQSAKPPQPTKRVAFVAAAPTAMPRATLTAGITEAEAIPAARTTLGRALYEPARGAYLGVAVDAEAAKGDPQVLGGLMRDWNTRSGRQHALQLSFVQFPTPEGIFPAFDSDPRGWMAPRAFCEASDQNGAAPILTLEPMTNPQQFSRGWKAGAPAFEAAKVFAQGVGRWQKPIFIRWAHEMNGSWYPWAEWNDKNQNMTRDKGEDTGFTPADYRASYRNMAAMFRRYAPNAALVWCPNSGLLGGERRDVFKPFYPGDDVVDWVGLDVYERGWTGPQPGAHLWGGQFAHNLSNDMLDDARTKANESADFYQTYAQKKRKPMMLAETSATLSYRTDLEASARAALNNEWKSAYWNDAEYGWMQSVYGTSTWEKAHAQKLLQPIDVKFPQLKAVVWFQLAKQEWIPVERTRNGRKSYQWFNDTYTDYRIGGGVAKSAESPFADEELGLYRELTASPHFLSQIQK